MIKKAILYLILCISALSIISCSKTSTGSFQINEKGADFTLFTMFDGYRSLEAAWDSVDGGMGNVKMAALLNNDDAYSADFFKILSEIMNEDSGSLDDVIKVLGLIIDKSDRFNNKPGIDSFYSSSPETYNNNFYGLIDSMTAGGSSNNLKDVLFTNLRSGLDHILTTKSNSELRDVMVDLVDMLNGLEQDAFMDLAEMGGKALVAADYPMWLDGSGDLITDYASMNAGTNTGLGNMSKGIHAMMSAMVQMAGTDPIDRGEVYDVINDINDKITADNVTILKELICNMEDYFTVGGAVYEAQGVYSTNDSTMFSDSELKDTLRDVLVGQLPLLLREDRSGSLFENAASKEYILNRVFSAIDTVYLDWHKAQIKESIYDIIRFDSFGRDRRVAGSYSASLLESFLFLGAVSSNFGWEHGGGTDELAGSNGYDDVGNDHGHGRYTGVLSLNDSLFSIKSTTELGLGTYSLAFSTGWNHEDHLFRSKNSFNTGNKNNFRFNFDYNFNALHFLTGACVGDSGSPSGGNPGGGDGLTLNNYQAYCGNGLEEPNLAGWTMGWIMRACWEGEGPYYYKDPDAETVTINGFTGKKYMRPNGKIYALVNVSGDYYYPAEGSDPVDAAASGQRENRYKATWQTEYYMLSNEGNNKHYVFSDMSSGDATTAEALTYTEKIAEDSTARECASQEEAIFRNYQWVMTEKKMVFLIPMWLRANALGMCPEESAIFQIIEGNGFTGLTSARKFRGNGVWAKANTSGASTIPGDYRITVLAKAIQGLVAINASKVYNDTLGRGTATPGAVGHNLAPLFRFAFPRSSKVTTAAYEHYQLGSQDFAVDDNTWLKRNALTPLIVALFGTIHENSSVSNKALRKMLEGLNPLGRPLAYYNHGIDGNICRDGWIFRIKGEGGGTNCAKPHASFLMPDWDVNGFDENTSSITAWHGGWAARNYFQPADYPTLMTLLIDRDNSIDRSDISKRADGLLAIFTEYNVNAGAGRPPVDSTPADPPSKDYDDPAGLDYTTPDFDNATYSQWGVKRKIFYSLEQLMSGIKMSKGVGTTINENNSIGGSPTKNLIPPKWLFQKRDVDLDLDPILEKMIGPNADSTGLAHLPDDKPAPDLPWEGVDENIDDLKAFITDYLTLAGSDSISEALLDILDAILASNNISDDHIAGLLHTLGKFLIFYDADPDGNPLTDDGTWVYQGDDKFNSLYNLMKNMLPRMHGVIDDGTGENYYKMLSNMKALIAEDGLGTFIFDNVSISPYQTGDFFEDLHSWLESDLVSGPGDRFWPVLGSLLYDLGEAVRNAPSGTDLIMIFEHYGFQRNEW